MKMYMANSNLTYLHPSIQSSINSTESTYAVADGISTLFVADVFEKGVDNKVQLVTSVDEFIFNYGEPNFTKYGQAAYNVMKWLENNGQAYVLRILPENAQYAHAVINIQTKKTSNTKSVMNDKGEIIKNALDDVYLRPSISYITKNNISENSLINEITIDRNNENSVDGYENHFLMVVYPLGRGSSYNNLGFRISLNTGYDTYFPSRVYNFEVVKYDEDLNVTTVEGPFFVTFDPDSLNSSNESMFIENVINRYSNYVRVSFNVEEYIKIANIINPNVNPRGIDILTGISKNNIEGNAETYYDIVLGNNVDTHISLHKYDENGSTVLKNDEIVLNISDYDSIVETAILSLDNSVKQSTYNRESDKFNYMKTDCYSKLSQNLDSFKNNSSAVMKNISDSQKECKKVIAGDGTSVNDYLLTVNVNKLHNDIKSLMSDPTSEGININTDFSEVTLINSNSEIAINKLLSDCNNLNAIYAFINDNGVSEDFIINQNNIINNINNISMIDIESTQHRSNLLDISNNLLILKLGNYSGTYENEYNTILANIRDEINFVQNSLISIAYSKDGLEDKKAEVIDLFFHTGGAENGKINITDIYNSARESLNKLSTGFFPDELNLTEEEQQKIIEAGGKLESNKIFKENIETSCTNLIDYLINLIMYIMGDVYSQYILNSLSQSESLIANANKAKTKVDETLDNKTQDELLEDGLANIDLASAKLASKNSILFTNSLQNFNNPIKFTLGSDGDFEYDASKLAERNKAIKNLMIKAYKGNIDSEITNKRLIEFDHVLDCNYDIEVKNAIVSLARDIRGDFFFWADTNHCANPDEAVRFRRDKFTVSNRLVGIFTQDLTFYDEYTGKDIKFTTPYILAQKIPYCATNYGLQYPIAGPRRGLIDGFKALSWSPNEAYKEKLYTMKVNYIEQNTKNTRIGSQLSTENGNTPLSNINNVLTVLKIQRNVEKIAEDYLFEFNTSETRNNLAAALNDYCSAYVSNRSCEKINVTVTATDYDKLQKIVRVGIEIKFHDIIERIYISLDVQK